VKDRRRHLAEKNVRDRETRFERSIYGTPFGATRIDKLHTLAIVEWRHGLGLGAANADRTFRMLRAALNLAVKSRKVDPVLKREWREVPRLDAGEARRDLFLDLAQRRAFLAAALPGPVADLVEATILTGARAGDLVRGDSNAGQRRPHCRQHRHAGLTASVTACWPVPSPVNFQLPPRRHQATLL
jgi:hypothetical protein